MGDQDKDAGHLRTGGRDGGEGSFVWDDHSRLYFHSSSGFYHDPSAGWYYNTNDGLYYKFEDGHYVPWDSDEKNLRSQESSAQTLENPPPPSEWLEETLINLYLNNYSDELAPARCSSTAEKDGKIILHRRDHVFHPSKIMNSLPDDAHDEEEEREIESSWLAQYGQVVKEALTFPVVDLWEWRLVEEKVNKGEKATRLAGRLIKRSSKLHPSVSSAAGFLKSARICKVNLDLVQVETGKVYRLRNPSAEYLSSLSAYDSSNPTKNWSFPILDLESITNSLRPKDLLASSLQTDSSSVNIPCKKYRDRAAERRALHGSAGVHATDGEDMISGSFHEDECEPDAFGIHSYGRRVLESMGWREGEAIGKTNKGLLQPLQVVGNKGTGGLGWSNERVVQ